MHGAFRPTAHADTHAGSGRCLPRLARFAALLAMLLLPAMTQAASRIAVLDPGHAEILAALGAEDRLVLVPDDPALDRHFPHAVRYRRMPSAESLLAQGPDLLIGGNPQRDRQLLVQADRLGIERVMIERTLPAIERVRRLAAHAGRETQGAELIARIESDYAAAAERIDGQPRVRVLHLSSSGAGSAGTVTGAGRETSADDLIRRAGGINVGAEAGLDRYQTLSAEGVMAMSPEAVLVSDLELPALGGAEGIWRAVPGLAHTPAARHRRLIVLDHAAVKFDAATSGQATQALAEALHAP